MRVVVFSDLHVDGGYRLGDPDPEWERTTLRDTRRVLRSICQTPCDVLVFLGDLAMGKRPGPLALALVQDELAGASAPSIAFVEGNHDDRGTWARSCLDVVAAGTGKRTHVFHEPDVIDLGGLQIGALPWATPRRFYPTSPTAADAHRQAALALEAITRGLAQRLDPSKPSLLCAHWLLSGSTLTDPGKDIREVTEPLLGVPELEATGFGAIVAGHNHKSQQVGPRTWVCGTPCRRSFHEEHLEPGYLVVDYDGVTASIERVPTTDRPLRTVRVDGSALLAGERPALGDLKGAVVRIEGSCTPEQRRALVAMDVNTQLHDACVLAGAVKVLKPNWQDAVRERIARSDLQADAPPTDALAVWLARQELPEEKVKRALALAGEIMGPH